MAAVEALLAFANLDQVRTGLKESVFKQNSPLVQLTLVDGLVAINDKAAIPIFERLISSNDVHQAVKDRSREGITKLI
jgi:HEAT repeat protein